MTLGTTERLAAWVMFLNAHSVVVEALGRDLERKFGLPLTWYEVLLSLGMSEQGKQRMLDLSRSLLLSKSGVTRLIDRMETAGLVTRRPSPEDRRVVWAVLTPRGRRMFRAAAPVHLRGVERHFMAALSDDEVRGLTAALRKVLLANGGPEACHEPDDFRVVAEVCVRQRSVARSR